MSPSFRYTVRACRVISQSLQIQGQANLRSAARVSSRYQAATTRGFISCRPSFAEAAAPSSSATANAAATESSLQTESSTLPSLNESDPNKVDWSRSFHGLSQQAFPKEAADILLAPIDPKIIEIKPDGIIYLPEIHYRRILNRAFGPGAWGLAPRGETIVTDKAVTREYALVAQGRLVSVARGEQDYFSKDGIPTASEGCKSNAMVRCCKDLGIASELWDPRYIRDWKAKHTREVFVENVNTKRRTKMWLRKGDPVSYPFKETNGGAAASSKP